VGERRIGRRAQRKQSTKHFFPNYSPYILLPRQLSTVERASKTDHFATLFLYIVHLHPPSPADLIGLKKKPF
jgi:hypothetical protein